MDRLLVSISPENVYGITPEGWNIVSTVIRAGSSFWMQETPDLVAPCTVFLKSHRTATSLDGSAIRSRHTSFRFTFWHVQAVVRSSCPLSVPIWGAIRVSTGIATRTWLWTTWVAVWKSGVLWTTFTRTETGTAVQTVSDARGTVSETRFRAWGMDTEPSAKSGKDAIACGVPAF